MHARPLPVRSFWRGLAALIATLAGALPALAQDADWSGAWDSQWRDGAAALYFEQEGNIVTGTYPVLDGTMRGEARGQLLVGNWEDPNGAGRFVFAMGPDGETFTGRFGTGEWWTGARLGDAIPGGTVAADASSPVTAMQSFVTAGNAARNNRSDRIGPALAVLDFDDLAPEATATAGDRLRLATSLFQVLDLLTFRTWSMPTPRPGQEEVTAELSQAGTAETFELRFRYSVRANGAAGWFIVVPDQATMREARERLLALFGGQPPHPTEHHDLRSPRDTMRTFLEQWWLWQDGGDSDLLFETMDLSAISATARQDEAALRAQYLKEVIDRVGFVLWQEVPNNPDQRGAYTHFTHPSGRIEIAPYDIGGTDGEDTRRVWQFTDTTLEGARELYMALEDMPLDDGLMTGNTADFIALRNAIRSVDRDLIRDVFGVEIWQWLVLVLGLLLSVPLSWLVAYLLLRVLLGLRRQEDEVLSVKSRFVWPVQFLIIAGIGLVTLRYLGLPEHVDVPLRILIGVVLAIAGGWLAYNIVDKLGTLAQQAAGRFAYRDEMLRSLVIALAKVGVVIGAIMVLAEVLSLPYQGVLAGLGIGGLAVALAARSTLENFIGGLTLLADKPVQVGDFCAFGDKIGTVEGTGLRSVRVRSLDRTIVTIPNAEFVNLYIENYARRDRILLKTVLNLRYETTPDQLRWVLAEIRKTLLQHERVLADPARARFVGFGAYSLDIEIFAYVDSADWGEFLTIREDIYLRFIDAVEAAGTGFAFPSSVNYLARDGGVDAARQQAAEEAVRDWREHDRMPFPEFADEERWGMFNQMPFPPPGSPHSARAKQRLEEGPSA